MTINESRFLRDIEKHEMRIVRDDGVYRHLVFRAPDTGNQRFELITWPGHLCYSGDMGTFIFARLPDMFEFFRTDRLRGFRRNGEHLAINPGYWAEKALAADVQVGLKEFDEARFTRAVLSDLRQWLRDYRADTTREERRDLWEEVVSEVLEAEGDKRAAAMEFHHMVNADVGAFCFDDFWEHNLERYTPHFMWCCYALAWGVEQYDNAKAAQEAVPA